MLDTSLEYGFPNREAAFVAHRILKLLVWKEAFNK